MAIPSGNGVPIVVIAKTPEDYQQWLTQQRKKQQPQLMHHGIHSSPKHTGKALAVLPKKTLMLMGKKGYEQHCAVCHKSDGTGMPPVIHAIRGSRIVVGDVRKHIALVLYGVTGTAMQAFGHQLSDEQLAAIITYQRNSWGNQDRKRYGKKAGGIVQPKQVSAIRVQHGE